MAFSNVDNLTMGNILQILFAKNAVQQLSTDAPEAEFAKVFKANVDPAREFRFFLLESLSPAAITPNNPGSTQSSFGTAQTPTSNEYTSKFKEISGPLSIELNLWERANASPAKYGEPLVIRAQALIDSWKRYFSKRFYGDGTGVLGKASAAADTTGASGSVLVTVPVNSAGTSFIGWFEVGDKVKAWYNNSGTMTHRAPTVAAGTFDYWRVDYIDRDNEKAKLSPILTTGAVANLTASNIVSGDYIFPDNLTTIANHDDGISDYGVASEVHPGLEALGGSGLTVWGISQAANTPLAGTQYSESAVIDERMLRKALDKLYIRIGRNKYNYGKVLCSPESAGALIDARETNRRFQAVSDDTAGATGFAYQHYGIRHMFEPVEFCPTNRLWVLPKGKNGVSPIECPMIDFKQVSINGQDTFLEPGTSTYVQMLHQFWKGYLTMYSRHPASILSVRGFTNS